MLYYFQDFVSRTFIAYEASRYKYTRKFYNIPLIMSAILEARA